MPWKASSVMEERLRFVARLLDGETMTEICREFGVSRKTGYKIFDRYREHGLEALSDRSRRPIRYANQLPPQLETLIVRLKGEKPHWGARKIRELLVRRLDGDIRVPAKSTIHAVLDRHGLVKRSGGPRHRARGTLLSQGTLPNDLWCADFKGEFKLGNGRYCYPLTVTDHASRFLLLCEALDSTREEPAITAFEQLFRERGLPLAIRSDNGVPFASPMPCSISQSSRCGGSGSALPSSASSPDIRNRTVGMSACISPSRRKPPARQASTACSSRSASMPSSASSTPNVRTRRST
jgi:transposase InsO family protein